ncbi:ribosome maturation factor RimP [Ornithinimicrobium cerasi]|uniref:ribosome maturation factor RimP n=1 Tax=Ornithinimicrobium cerasi TaxID=2248773 RepID=UPI000EFE04F9|nr:ribosome maturation factor RimP [Ornithinimicrobium cerasi]
MDARQRTDEVTAAASQALRGTGVVVDDATVQQAGRRRLVRVFLARDLSGLAADDVASPVDPLSLDEIAEATRAVSAGLDEAGVMGEAPYTLEVSSPGVDRPLLRRDHFRRNVGRLVTVTTAGGPELSGRVSGVGDGGVRLLLDTHEETELPWADVVRGVVQVEFSRPERKDH